MFTSFFLTLLLSGFGNEEAGTSAFPILRQAFGPRASALGESYVALSNDATAAWWNPAGLGTIEQNYVYFSHQEWFLDTQDEYASGIMHTPYGTFSACIIYSGIADVESWSENEQQLSSFNTSTTLVHLAFGGEIVDGLFIGGGLKGIHDDLHTVTATGGCMDIGVLYHFKEWISIGGVLQNLGPSINYTTTAVPLPIGARAGLRIAYREDLTYVLDGNIPSKGKPELHTGLEYSLLNTLHLRAGLRTGPQSTSVGIFTFGTGINWLNLGFDYAFVPYSILGSTHRIAISYSFRSFFEKEKKRGITIMGADAYTNAPLNALIEFQRAQEGKEWTDAEGRFHRKSFPEGITQIIVSKAGYATATDSFYHKKNKYTEIKVLLRKPMPSAIIGVICDAVTKKTISGTISFSGPSSGSTETKENGNYEIGNLYQGTYTLTASSPSYISQSADIIIGSGELKEKSFHLVRGEGTITLRDILFDTGKALLREEAFEILNSIGMVLRENPSYALTIEGHTDPREIHTAEFPSNRELSRARANSAKNYIIEHFDIDPECIETEGYADTKPIAPNDTEENLQKNRRVEFTIMK